MLFVQVNYVACNVHESSCIVLYSKLKRYSSTVRNYGHFLKSTLRLQR